MTEKMQKFLELASANEELKKKLETSAKETLIELAKENGIDLTEEDFARETGELSEEELGAVAGGGDCSCVGEGTGMGDPMNETKTCTCVKVGIGQTEDNIRRCGCTAAGTGIEHQIA